MVSDVGTTNSVSMKRLVPAIFLSSVGAVLFSLSLFRLLSFFIMPSMFFALLLVGFPIGAALAARRPQSDVPRFRRLLLVMQVVMALSICGTLFCKHIDYMRANLLFGIDPQDLLTQVLIFALLYLPFFAAYGAAEYVGYLSGTIAFGERMRPVYGLFLFGAAAAFAIAANLQQVVGVPRLLLVAVATVSVSRMLLTRRPTAPNTVGLVAIVAACSWPAFDRTFMDAFKLSKDVEMSVNNKLQEEDAEVTFAGWGKYSYLEIVRRPLDDPDTPHFYSGFYNDTGMWNVIPDEFATKSARSQIPALFLPPGGGGSVAIVGAGAGREAVHAREAGAERILALEIEPGVVNAVKGPLKEEFDEAYTKPPVEVRVGEARSYLESTDEKFDLLSLMSVGGYPQLMLEPGNMIRTSEAFELLVDRMTDEGVLVIVYDIILDKKGTLLKQYYHTLRKLDMEVYTFMHPEAFYLIAEHRGASPELKRRRAKAREELTAELSPLSELDMYMPEFQEITDNRPFLAGNISNILSESQIWWLCGVLGGIVVATGGIFAFPLVKRLRASGSNQREFGFLFLGVLVGANFMLMEHLCVIQLFQRMYAYYDAMMISIICFLTLTGLGSFLLPRKAIGAVTLVTIASTSVWWWRVGEWTDVQVLAFAIPPVMATGTFFPLIFERVPGGRLQLFAMDALGSAIGALIAFFVPMLYGFHAFTAVAVAMFLTTGLCMLFFLMGMLDRSTSATS